jgi:hypothetical protein
VWAEGSEKRTRVIGRRSKQRSLYSHGLMSAQTVKWRQTPTTSIQCSDAEKERSTSQVTVNLFQIFLSVVAVAYLPIGPVLRAAASPLGHYNEPSRRDLHMTRLAVVSWLVEPPIGTISTHHAAGQTRGRSENRSTLSSTSSKSSCLMPLAES